MHIFNKNQEIIIKDNKNIIKIIPNAEDCQKFLTLTQEMFSRKLTLTCRNERPLVSCAGGKLNENIKIEIKIAVDESYMILGKDDFNIKLPFDKEILRDLINSLKSFLFNDIESYYETKKRELTLLFNKI